MKTFLNPAYKKNNIPVVLSANNNYAPYLAVTIQSIVKNSSLNNNYDIVILEREISETNKKLICSLSKQHNISIRFLNISPLLKDYKFHTNTYFSEETYYRLFITSVFSNYEKVIYLDCDIIVLNDIANLFIQELKNNLLAATYNISTYLHTIDNKLVKDIPWRTYLIDILNMKKPEKYFQAGVLVLNINRMLQYKFQKKALDKAQSFEPVLVDQDVMNSVCREKVLYFSQKWNFHNHFSSRYNNLHLIEKLPKNLAEDYLSARSNPYIIHYAGREKPWSYPNLEYAELWWEYARQTPFYEQIIYKNAQTQNGDEISQKTKELITILQYPKYRSKYLKYKILSKITFGKLRKRYKKKRKELKAKLWYIRGIIKQYGEKI